MKLRAVTFVLASLFIGCGKKASPSLEGAPLPVSTTLKAPSTTHPTLALGNLDAQIEGHQKQVERSPGDPMLASALLDSLLVRAQFLGRISDLERGDALSAALLARAPTRYEAHLARAKMHGALHRFPAALVELDAAVKLGAPGSGVASARASVYLAVGRVDEIAVLGAWQEAGDPLTLVNVASYQAELGRVQHADTLFERARALYRDVSPFAIAFMDFQRASVLARAGDRARAKAYFAEAVQVLPAYAHAAVHLAGLSTAQEAVTILQPLLATTEDPEVLASLADAERRTGAAAAAETHLAQAKARYEALLADHPEAFYDHAASFYLGAGHDPARALELAHKNVTLRPTEASIDLWLTAAQVAKADVCEAVAAGLHLPHARPEFLSRLQSAGSHCAGAH